MGKLEHNRTCISCIYYVHFNELSSGLAHLIELEGVQDEGHGICYISGETVDVMDSCFEYEG